MMQLTFFPTKPASVPGIILRLGLLMVFVALGTYLLYGTIVLSWAGAGILFGLFTPIIILTIIVQIRLRRSIARRE